jgi:OFA family oxalate/formate antiporter-like MFS transporter
MQSNSETGSSIVMKGILVVTAAAIFEFCLGTFYAWSIFVKPIMALHGWEKTQALWPMTLNAVMTGIAAFIIGARADRSPRSVAILSSLLWGLGLIGAGYAVHHGNLSLLNWTFGFFGGIGVGLGYITGIAVPLKWMPHRRGLVSGIVILAFGAGGMIIAKLGPAWIASLGKEGPGNFLFGMGLACLIICLITSFLLINPPGYTPKAAPASLKTLLPTEVLTSGRFWAIWIMIFINVYAGFAIISQAAPMSNELLKFNNEQAGMFLMFILLANGIGRILWSSISDKLGTKPVLVFMFISMAAVFFGLFHIKNPYAFAAACCYVVLCYGGIFGTMPAFSASIFGVGQMGRFYGPVLTAISAGVLFVQYYFTALLKEQGYGLPFKLIAGSLVLAMILPMLISRKNTPSADSAATVKK